MGKAGTWYHSIPLIPIHVHYELTAPHHTWMLFLDMRNPHLGFPDLNRSTVPATGSFSKQNLTCLLIVGLWCGIWEESGEELYMCVSTMVIEAKGHVFFLILLLYTVIGRGE